MKKISVTLDIKKNRLDKFMTFAIKKLSRNKIQALIAAGRVRVNSDLITDVNYNLKYSDEIFVNDDDFEIEKPDLAPDKNVKFSVLYEDDDLLVIDKPAGITVHPGAGNYSNTLVNGLVYRCGESLSSGSGEYRPGIVHRIDKNTSGILVVAKNDFSHCELAKQFSTHSIKRKYICLCYSFPQPLIGKIQTLIARDRNNRLKMAVSKESGRNAITFYRTLKTFSKYASKVECELKTGRTHQIRVHLSHLGCPLIGDSIYRTKNHHAPNEISDYINEFPRQALHAYFLEFTHPRSEEPMHFESQPPNDMQELEEVLKRNLPIYT
ncbi:MAG: RluA family pseudouridine synthase [Holosporaceae bacterium]|jgi:23S rRNA pseudouridine1911/1915/1917 synthase|nr:RluA family pseudouridine synthase [Holosporaceae bacterium]